MSKIFCDLCDWKQEGDNLQQMTFWHNKKCPKCSKSIIITDFDYQHIQFIRSLRGKVSIMDNKGYILKVKVGNMIADITIKQINK